MSQDFEGGYIGESIVMRSFRPSMKHIEAGDVEP